ncbi:hypothetical protein QQS21_004881 [Conoideocrella luteorostrata]|uniref:G domain-containing protein n=1 Tax=Conoideocrella luteorostrata TaxID=1105319 RepID=A0AAJ0CQH3_9HYPO|nr:hypothetical protein QQS21_004881 [Conoideocrella luteorostrata]
MTQIALTHPTTHAPMSASTEAEDKRLTFEIPEFDIESPDEDCGTDDHEIAPPAGPDRPPNWCATSFAALSKVVAKAKGAASKPVVSFIKRYLRGTKLVFVVGQSGTGKTTLLGELTGQELPVGKTHKSEYQGTKAHHVYPAIIEGEQYIFVDTAGFGAADVDDMENFYDIVACLDALAPFITIAGLLFVYGGNQSRMMNPDLTTIQWVKCFCGPEFFQSITFVTTKWDSLSEDAFEDCWEKNLPSLLKDKCIQEFLEPEPIGSYRYHGAQIYHHGIKGGKGSKLAADTQILSLKRKPRERAQTVKSMIHNRYRNPLNVKLQVLEEMARGTPWGQTEAAKVLQNNPSSIDLQMENNFVRISVRKWLAVGKAQATELAAGMGVAETQKETPCDTGEEQERKAPRVDRVDPKVPEEMPYKPRKSWSEKLFPWLETAKELALFFLNARMETPAAEPRAWTGYWGSLRNWWSGSKPEEKRWVFYERND